MKCHESHSGSKRLISLLLLLSLVSLCLPWFTIFSPGLPVLYWTSFTPESGLSPFTIRCSGISRPSWIGFFHHCPPGPETSLFPQFAILWWIYSNIRMFKYIGHEFPRMSHSALVIQRGGWICIEGKLVQTAPSVLSAKSAKELLLTRISGDPNF